MVGARLVVVVETVVGARLVVVVDDLTVVLGTVDLVVVVVARAVVVRVVVFVMVLPSVVGSSRGTKSTIPSALSLLLTTTSW